MSDLAAQVELSTSGVTRLIDRMAAAGLVERAACSTDRRGAFAVLTAAGLARVESAVPGHLDIIEKWFVGLLSGGERQRLDQSLRNVRDAVRPGAVAGASAAPSEPIDLTDSVHSLR